MNKEFVPYNESLELKQLGFDGIYTFKVYDSTTKELIFSELGNVVSGYILAPLYQQAFRWFREKYGLDSYIIPARLETKKVYDYYIWFTNEKYERDLFIGMNNQYTYKEAELACLKKLIEIVKAKQ